MPRVDVFLTYYKPHVSGLTNMAIDLAEDAAAHGFEVHVHCVSLQGPESTSIDAGVVVHAYRKTFALGRAAFSIQLILAIWRMRRGGGVAHVHMPYPESFLIAALFASNWRIVNTYQCDAPLDGCARSLQARLLDWSHRRLIRRAQVTSASSMDYLEHSRLRDDMLEHGGTAIPATAPDRRGGTPRFKVPGKRLVGFLGRPTYEKGIDVLMSALERFPRDDVALLLAGPVEGVREHVGYDVARLQRLVESGRVVSIGFVPDAELPDFFASLDLFVYPSINSFDAFGIVQVEAMSAGVPVVASSLPGVRTIVGSTGFGEIAKVGDADDLIRALLVALDREYDPGVAREALESTYLPPVPQAAYRAVLSGSGR